MCPYENASSVFPLHISWDIRLCSKAICPLDHKALLFRTAVFCWTKERNQYNAIWYKAVIVFQGQIVSFIWHISTFIYPAWLGSGYLQMWRSDELEVISVCFVIPLRFLEVIAIVKAWFSKMPLTEMQEVHFSSTSVQLLLNMPYVLFSSWHKKKQCLYADPHPLTTAHRASLCPGIQHKSWFVQKPPLCLTSCSPMGPNQTLWLSEMH